MALQQGIVTITGRVGTQPAQFGNDPQRMGCKFRLACTRAYRDRDGQWQNMPTIWITVKAFRMLAQHILYSINRGEPVIVTGSLASEEWTGEDNKLHARLVVEATAVGHDLNYGITTLRKVERSHDDPAHPRPTRSADPLNASPTASYGAPYQAYPPLGATTDTAAMASDTDVSTPTVDSTPSSEPSDVMESADQLSTPTGAYENADDGNESQEDAF